MIQSVTFDFTSQRHEPAHFTVPMEVREALRLGVDGWIYLDLWTSAGRARGNFLMTSNGEVRASAKDDGPNRGLLGVVGAAMWGIAVATSPSSS
jgi:hypothetical protein